MISADFHVKNDNILVYQMLNQAVGHKWEDVLKMSAEQIPAGLFSACRQNHMHAISDPPQCCQIHHKLKAPQAHYQLLLLKATHFPAETPNIKWAFKEIA